MQSSTNVEDMVDPDGRPPWLHLLSPVQGAWREKQMPKGRDPDTYIEQKLREPVEWPIEPALGDLVA
jgi:hypothetical protein